MERKEQKEKPEEEMWAERVELLDEVKIEEVDPEEAPRSLIRTKATLRFEPLQRPSLSVGETEENSSPRPIGTPENLNLSMEAMQESPSVELSAISSTSAEIPPRHTLPQSLELSETSIPSVTEVQQNSSQRPKEPSKLNSNSSKSGCCTIL